MQQSRGIKAEAAKNRQQRRCSREDAAEKMQQAASIDSEGAACTWSRAQSVMEPSTDSCPLVSAGERMGTAPRSSAHCRAITSAGAAPSPPAATTCTARAVNGTCCSSACTPCDAGSLTQVLASLCGARAPRGPAMRRVRCAPMHGPTQVLNPHSPAHRREGRTALVEACMAMRLHCPTASAQAEACRR
jgi:hypothetical protein